MNQFTFDSKLRTRLFGLIGLGLICMVLTYINGEPGQLHDANVHARFWSNFLHNSVFFTGIAFVSLFVLTAFTTAWAGWYVMFKRIWEAYAFFLIPGLILMMIVAAGNWGHFHHLYHWADPSVLDPASENYDEILVGKSSFLNNGWYTFGSVIIVGIWIFFLMKLRSLSLGEDKHGTTDFSYHQKIRWWSAAFLPIAGFSSAAIIWQWVMSVDSHWYSTLYAWYCTVSWFVAAMCLTVLTLIFLKSRGYYESVTQEHLHDLGKYIFAFSVFWTYLWFSQYMLIWYGNVGEETIYFRERIDHYPVLHYGNLIINFGLPFLILMRNSNKRKYGVLVFMSVLLFFGHWWDYFLMIKPGTFETAEHLAHMMAPTAEHGHGLDHHSAGFASGFTIPGLLEIGTMLGFLGAFLLVAFTQLAKANLEPKNDPYYGESMHHEVLQEAGDHGH